MGSLVPKDYPYFNLLLKIMINRQLKYVLLLLTLLMSCQQPKFSFDLEQEVIRIPLIIERGRYYSYVVVDGDSIRMWIDTGAGSFLCSEFSSRTIRRRQSRDAGGFRRMIPVGRVKEMHWGGLRIENLLVRNDVAHYGGSRNIIGGDILRNFVVQFDNESREIVLTKNPQLIERRGIKVPFTFRGSRHVMVPLTLNGTERDFILDTGYSRELTVDAAFFYSSGLFELENVEWRGNLINPFFLPESLRERGVARITMVDCKLGEKIFPNTIVTHYNNWRINVIGSAFLQRFSTFTIDYINGYVYFELPEGAILSYENLIQTVPFVYLNLLRDRVNSLGIQFFHRADVSTVSALIHDEAFGGIEIGDTLVGVNQTIFNEATFNKLGATIDLFRLETNRFLQINALNIAFSEDKATFHFLKNGELVSFNRVRNRVLYPEPRVSRHIVSEFDFLMLQAIEGGYLVVDSITTEPDGSQMFHRPRPAFIP